MHHTCMVHEYMVILKIRSIFSSPELIICLLKRSLLRSLDETVDLTNGTHCTQNLSLTVL